MYRCLAMLLLTLWLLLAGCAPDPRLEAEADATRLKAESQAASEQQARDQQQAAFELEHARQEAQSAQVVASKNMFVFWFMLFATIAASAAVLGLGIGFGWGSVGVGRAIANLAMVRSNLVYMDKNTRAFPIIEYKAKGLFTVTDMNTGAVRLLNTAREADRQALLNMGALNLAGMVAYEARKSKDPTGVAMVGTNPQLPESHIELPDGKVLEVGQWAARALADPGE